MNVRGSLSKQMRITTRFFGKPLSDVHLEALAGLFNWSIPEFLEPAQEGDAAVLA
jgi:hypothetical protein